MSAKALSPVPNDTKLVAAHQRRQRILSDIAHSSSRLMGLNDRHSHDDKLAQLTMGVGLAAQVFSNPLAVEDRLERIAAFCIGWLESMGEKRAFDLVLAERVRQTTLYRQQPNKYLVVMNSTVTDPKRKLRVLVEELGEVAEAIDRLERTVTAWVDVKREIVQVAAVAVAWLETPEVKP